MHIDICIDFEAPHWLKRAARAGLPAMLFVSMIGIVRADVAVPNTFADGTTLSAAAMNANFAALANAIDQAAPVGAVMAYFGAEAPSGWLIANGTTIDKSSNPAYTALVDHLRALNDTQGTTNLIDANQALLPDLRGQFLRGQDRDAAVNPDCGDDLIGQLQDSEIDSHYHENTKGYVGTGDHHWSFGDGSLSAAGTGGANFTDTGPAGGNETRPVNVTVLYVIKY